MFRNISAFQITHDTVYFIKGKTRFTAIDFIAFDSVKFDPKDSSSLSRVLSELAAKYDIYGSKIITSLPTHNVVMKNISFPFSDKKRIAEVIPNEAEENIPISLDTLYYHFQILQTSSLETEVLLCATEKELCDSIKNNFSESGHSLNAIYIESNSLFNLVKFSEHRSSGYIYHVDFGAERTIINFIKNNVLVYTRVLQNGYSECLSKLTGNKTVSLEEFERLSNGLNTEKPSKEDINKLSKRLKISAKTAEKNIADYAIAAARLSKNIANTIHIYEKTNGKPDPEKILISGNAAFTQLFANELFKSTDTPVYEISAASVLKNNKISNEFNIVSGLLLSDVFAPDQINFMQDITVSTGSIFGEFKIPAVFVASGLALFFLYFCVSLIILSVKGGANEKLLSEQFKQYFRKEAKTGNIIDEAKTIRDTEKKELSNYTAFMPKDRSVLLSLDDVLKSFAGDTTFNLKDITLTEKQIQINGETADPAKIDEFKNKLIQSGKYLSVDLSTNFSGKSGSKFNLVIKLKDKEGSSK